MASTSAAPAINGDADATAKQNETIPKPTQDPTSKSGEESQNEGLQRNPTSNTTFSNSPEKSESTAATQDGVESEDATKVEEKPSFVKKTVDKLGLDVPTVLIMAKYESLCPVEKWYANSCIIAEVDFHRLLL